MKEGVREAQPLASHADGLDAKSLDRLVTERMTEHFARLLRTPLQEGLLWSGTMTDLVESTHIVWLTGRFTAADGRPISFRELLARACRVLHRHMPSNAHAFLAQAARRKGVRSCSVLRRYAELITRARLINPFQMDLSYCKLKS